MSSPAAAVSHTTFHIQHHQYTHPSHHHQQHHLSPVTPARGPLPVIPDLRFESSYIRSIRRYVEVERIGEGSRGSGETNDAQLLQYASGKNSEIEKGEDLERDSSATLVSSLGPREIIHVQWKSVIWVTLRDQVLSPLVQGALWALASYYITPFSAQLGSRMGTFVHQTIPTKEGQGVAWLRGWGKSLGLSGTGGTVAPSRASNSSSYKYQDCK